MWIVATPIGTLGDLSPRGREILGSVELILAEDTRRARRLLAHLEVPTRGRLQSLHEHNEAQKVPALLANLQEGGSIALISDACTPVLSDPGYLLVRAARKEALPVSSVPGASAFTTALAASGQPPLPATLSGFLPSRSGPRQRRIAELDEAPWTLVILLSPHRLARELADLSDVLGAERRATLLAELSDHPPQAAGAKHIQAGSGFVQEEQCRPVCQRRRDGQGALHAAGELCKASVTLLTQAKALEEIFSPRHTLNTRYAVELHGKGQVVQRRKLCVKVGTVV